MQLELLPPLPLKNGILEIDNGFIEKLVTCPRSLLYNNLFRRTFVGEKAALNFGKAIHKALEARYLRCTNEPPDVFTETDIYNEVLVPHFQEFPQPEGDHRDLSYAFQIFHRYNLTYAHEPFNLMVNEATGEVATEVSFSVPFGEFEVTDPHPDRKGWSSFKLPVNYIGRIDLPVIWDKSVFVGDFKTSSMLGPKFFDGQKVSAQYEGYAWALEQTLKRPCGGFFIRALRTNPKPMKPQKGWDVWWSESLMTHKEYIRPGQLVEWKENTTRLLELFFHMYSSGYMPQYKKACTMYGKCQFYDVCYLPQEQRMQMLASEEFTDNNWSPLD